MSGAFGQNLEAPVLQVQHSALRRYNDDSCFKSKCPVCQEGILLVARHPETLELIDLDACIRCGQRVVYVDAVIGNEPVRKTEEGQ